MLRFLETKYLKNLTSLFSGNVISQVIPFILAPFITRIYGPDEMAQFAQFIALVSLLGIVSAGRLEFAILLPVSDNKVEKIIRTAPDSEIYLVDNCDAEQSKLNAKYRKIASDLKNNQAITDVINCDFDGINQIIDAIQSVEYTKFKIHELWHKLEKS